MIDICHPAHVHQFKNMIWDLQKRGHSIKLAAMDKDVTLSLLDAYGFDYVVLGSNTSANFMPRVALTIKSTIALAKAAKQFKPDIFISRGLIPTGFISNCFCKPYICILDSEHAKLEIAFAKVCSDVICTPSCFKKDLGKKHIVFNGYKELSYLHPNYFKPDPSVLSELKAETNKKLVIMRFVAFHAFHDARAYGFSLAMKRKMVEEFQKYGKVIITSESELPEDLRKYQLKLPPEKLHSILFYSDLYVGDGGTTAVEAALLGTPTVHCEKIVSGKKALSAIDIHGNFQELQNKYELLYSFINEKEAFNKASELLHSAEVKKEWGEKLGKLLADKIDITSFMVWFVENYPRSLQIYKEKRFV